MGILGLAAGKIERELVDAVAVLPRASTVEVQGVLHKLLINKQWQLNGSHRATVRPTKHVPAAVAEGGWRMPLQAVLSEVAMHATCWYHALPLIITTSRVSEVLMHLAKPDTVSNTQRVACPSTVAATRRAIGAVHVLQVGGSRTTAHGKWRPTTRYT